MAPSTAAPVDAAAPYAGFAVDAASGAEGCLDVAIQDRATTCCLGRGFGSLTELLGDLGVALDARGQTGGNRHCVPDAGFVHIAVADAIVVQGARRGTPSPEGREELCLGRL